MGGNEKERGRVENILFFNFLPPSICFFFVLKELEEVYVRVMMGKN